ncbi:hypothetical protein [Thiorhodococcus minor]|nr:hypothetical protein [Thiorhodococcus minor]
MRKLEITKAAAFLQMGSDMLRERAVAGELPDAKPSKTRVFCKKT